MFPSHKPNRQKMSYRILHLPPSHYENEVPLFPIIVFDDTPTDAAIHVADIYAKDMKQLQETLLRLKENEEDLSDDDDEEKTTKKDEELTYDNLIPRIRNELRDRGINVADTRLRLYKNDSMSQPAVAIVLPGETVFTSLRGETPLEILGQAIKHAETASAQTKLQTQIRNLLAERDSLRLQLQKVEECIERFRDDFPFIG